MAHAHDQAVLRLALRITWSQSDAQDICQAAFLKVYKKLGGFRFECSFSTWIHRIVTDLCLDHLWKNRNLTENSAIAVKGEEDDLLNQLANNPPHERMVFELKHFQG